MAIVVSKVISIESAKEHIKNGDTEYDFTG